MENEKKESTAKKAHIFAVFMQALKYSGGKCGNFDSRKGVRGYGHLQE